MCRQIADVLNIQVTADGSAFKVNVPGDQTNKLSVEKPVVLVV